jgi:para-nitrobenzyl esterase
MSEDCLFLNVWTPGGDGLPVMVWLHGGGFTVGFSNAFDGEHFATTNDVVVVTLNYRLGSLGWLGGGNYGLLDVAAALRWVQANIAAFGGDPARVTLAGQSAGALIAYDLMVSPLGEGLFHQAILESPPLFDASQPLERAERWARDMGDLAGAGPQEIVDRHEHLLREPRWAGTRGGASPTAIAGRERPLRILTGVNDDEGSFFPDPTLGDAIVESWSRWVEGRPNTLRYRARGTHGAEIPRVFHGDLTIMWGAFVKDGCVPNLKLDTLL